MHLCLRYNKDKISDTCAKEEMKLAALEYRDIRLRPKLNKLCSEEKAVYCKVGEGRVRAGVRGAAGRRHMLAVVPLSTEQHCAAAQ